MFNNITTYENEHQSIYYATNDWQIWSKPLGVSYIHIFALGGGGSGNSGAKGTVGTTRVGGSGGGSGAYMSVVYAAVNLFDILYVNVGKGGASKDLGGTAYIGNAGSATYVSYEDNIDTYKILALANGGGVGGSTTTAGAGGAATTITACPYLTSSLFYNLNAGVTGGAGGNPNPSNITSFSSSFITGGAGGAGTTGATPYSGANIIGYNYIPDITGGDNTGAEGGSGVYFRKPFCGLGGAGGGAINSGFGGSGGNGAYGCGGGGGGAGTFAGPSGNGGDGLVIITCW